LTTPNDLLGEVQLATGARLTKQALLAELERITE